MSRRKKEICCPRCGSQVPRDKLRTTPAVEPVSTAQRAADLEVILKEDLTLDYGMFPRVCVAYRWDTHLGKVTAYFAVRSEKDPFSKPHARRALAEHIAADTHKIQFKLSRGKNSPRELEEFRLFYAMEGHLLNRMLSHPHEFPSKLAKRVKRAKKIIDATTQFANSLKSALKDM